MKTTTNLSMLIFLLFGASMQVNAQESEPRENIQLGFKAGINYSNVWDEKKEEFKADAKTGFAGGVFMGIPIGKHIGFQPEILISQKGFKADGILLAKPYSFTRTTTYLDVPLQLQLKPADFITIVAGPQFSYLLSQKDTYTFGDNSIDQEQEFENENPRKNILGFVAGADLIFNHAVLSGRFGWDFQTNNGDGNSSTPRYRNRWVQLTLGLKI